jgi:hypothetical protein
MGGVPSLPRAIYAVADRDYFIGAVALLNSLRLVGHEEPLLLVDAGLTPSQRELLVPHVTLLAAPPGVPAVLLKLVGPLEHPAGVAILLDTDVIVVRPLTELVEAAEGGRLVAFVNNPPNDERFFADWSTVLGLGPLRRHPYLAAGQLLVPHHLTRRVLEQWAESQSKVDLRWTWMGRATLADPFYFADMDVFNAVAGSTLNPEEILAVEHRFAPNPPFTDLTLVDAERLVCRYPDASQPFLLHHILSKPWLKATRVNLYSMLLPRVLLAPDVTVRLSPEQLPLRLREGRLAAADRRRADAQAFLYTHGRRQLGRLQIRTRLRARRARHAAGA